ncbi:MAG: hypothetical protein AAFZ65_02000 [Planctomycetota bacterium]
MLSPRAKLLSPLLALLWALVGCQSVPPVAQVTPHGIIRAHDAEAGAAYADDFIEFRDRICELLPDTREGDVEIWVGELDHDHGPASETAWADAYTLTWSSGRTPRVHLPEQASTAPERRNLVAHELVHALLGPSWRTLPTALEEGLATWVATQLEPRSHQRITKLLAARPDRFARLEYSAEFAGRPVVLADPGLVLTIASARDTSLEEILAYPRDGQLYPEGRSEKLRLYGVGLALVETIIDRQGIEGLHALAARAGREGHKRIPAEWILSAAGADDPIGRARALRPELRPMDALWLVEHRGLWRQLAELYTGLKAAGKSVAQDPERFVEALNVHLTVGSRDSASWRDLPMYEDLRSELVSEIRRRERHEALFVASAR